MSSKALLKVLTTPSKIASALDWRKASGSVLSLDIHKDRIGLALASHPSFGGKATTLDSIKLSNKKKMKIDQECIDKLSQIVKEHKVCGFVVSFPVQQDTGRMGAACGRVLHTLDSLLSESSSSPSLGSSSSKIVTPNRPLCLWDSRHTKAEPEDEWGRCAAYTRTSDKNLHLASVEQYNQDENIVAAQVWDDFCRVNWPSLYAEQKEEKKRVRKEERAKEYSLSDSLENEAWDDSASYVKVALL